MSRSIYAASVSLATNAAGELNVFDLDRATSRVDGLQIGIFKEANEVSLCGLLQGDDCGGLETRPIWEPRAVGEALSNLPDQTLERQLANEQLRRTLVSLDFAQGDGAWLETRLLSDARGAHLSAQSGGHLLASHACHSLACHSLACHSLACQRSRLASSEARDNPSLSAELADLASHACCRPCCRHRRHASLIVARGTERHDPDRVNSIFFWGSRSPKNWGFFSGPSNTPRGMAVDLAMDAFTNCMVKIDDLNYTAKYNLHNPRQPPYQLPTFKERVIWEHVTSSYVAWMTSGKVLMVHVIDVKTHLKKHDITPLEVGEFINTFKFDKRTYTKALSTYQAAASSAPASGSVPALAAASNKSKRKHCEASMELESKKFKLTGMSVDEVKGIATEVNKECMGAEERIDVIRRFERSSDSSDKRVNISIASPAAAAAGAAVPVASSAAALDADLTTVLDLAAAHAPVAAPVAALAAAPTEATAQAPAAALIASPTAAHDKLSPLHPSPSASSSGAWWAKNESDTDLKMQLQEARERAEKAEERAEEADARSNRIRSTHETYKKSKQKEVSHLRTKCQLQPSRDDYDKLLSMHHKTVQSMTGEDFVAFKATKLATPEEAYEQILKLCGSALHDVFEDFKTSSATADTCCYEFLENDGSWNPINDSNIIDKLTYLLKNQGKVVYSIEGQNYEASLATKGKQVTWADDHDIDQLNTSTGAVRKIRFRQVSATDISDADKKKLASVLYGPKSFITLSKTFCDSLLNGFRFDLDQSYKLSLELSQLAEKFVSVGSGWKYTNRVGNLPTSATAPKFHSNTDPSGELECNSELFIKPIAIFNWLKIASDRGYTAARIVLHGASKEAYKSIRDDFMGFRLRNAGQNGQAHGNGTYFGLSDHITVTYNRKSGLPEGSAILALLLTDDDSGWKDKGSYTHVEDKNIPVEVTTFSLCNSFKKMRNAVCVHEGQLALPLGLVRAFDPSMGWILDSSAYGEV